MCGISLSGLALRTRSKVVKSIICEALGYPIPKSFVKTHPKFPCQNFDVYTQKSLNVQIWNEDLDFDRRYVFLHVTEDDLITDVRVITGKELSMYDKTGTLTHKYQALMTSLGKNMLFSENDTDNIRHLIANNSLDLTKTNPNALPKEKQLLSIKVIYNKLLPIVGKSIKYIDSVQERNRGAELHKLICNQIGYSQYDDDGTYPDITNQLIEIKLQTSPTIDLGRHSPEDDNIIINSSNMTFTSGDVRYVIFDAQHIQDRILLNNLYVVSGRDFTKYFPLFKGKVTNAKLQIPLPADFFSST